MGGPRKNSCSLWNHNWVPMRRGSRRETCTVCGTVFPCAHECGHFDCAVETQRALPDWARLVVERDES